VRGTARSSERLGYVRLVGALGALALLLKPWTQQRRGFIRPDNQSVAEMASLERVAADVASLGA
jgi:hypothetical protein